MSEKIVITRKDLFEQVWSEPMTKLAKKYGLSNVGLRKKIRKLSIPLPKRGYWQRKQFADPDPPPALPAYDGSEAIEFLNYPNRHNKKF